MPLRDLFIGTLKGSPLKESPRRAWGLASGNLFGKQRASTRLASSGFGLPGTVANKKPETQEFFQGLGLSLGSRV